MRSLVLIGAVSFVLGCGATNVDEGTGGSGDAAGNGGMAGGNGGAAGNGGMAARARAGAAAFPSATVTTSARSFEG